MILLDTHVWLWLNSAVEKIPREVLRIITEERDVYLSAASAWEISIKHATGKLKLPVRPEEYIPSRMEANGLIALPIRHEHAIQAAALPLHHRDPFDRMLVAQARMEELKLVTADSWIRDYQVEVLWG